jgi:outer membrane autotransporter protein
VKSVALRSSAVCCLTFILLSGTSLGSAAHAQSATWLANPGSSNLGAASNWSPAVVPAGTSFQATFGASSTTTLTGTLAVGTWQFLAGAPAYTFNPSGALSFSNGGIVNNSAYAPTFNLTAGPLLMVGSSSAGNAIFNIGSGLAAQILANATLANSTFGVSGTLRLSNSATAANATIAINSGGNLTFLNTSTGGNARLIANAGSTVNMSGITSAGLTAGSIEGAGTYALGTKLLTVGSNGLSTGVSGAITGTTGGLTKIGGGTLTLSGANTYTGATSLNAGGLVVNGSLASAVTVNDGFLGGTGSVGGLTVNGGALAPGNSIGTLNVAGNYIHNAGGTYQVEINAAGQSDRTNVTGTATLNGGAVQVIAAPGSYAASTTYTIVNAIGGVSGAYTGATTNLAFLAPTLSYDLNNVYLNVRTSFAGGGETPNEVAVGTALDGAAPSASGDLGTVIGALLGLDTVLGPAALTALSGQPYASFGTINVQADHLFMNAVGQQTKLARRGAAGARVALAEACEVACDTAAPGGWGTWMSGLGSVGSVGGDANSAALTYSMGGVAVGADRRIDEHLLVGLAAGYSNARQWVGGFPGGGSADTYSAGLYASFNQGGFYTDALAGYAYSDNQLQRPIAIAGLAPRTAQGRAGANQFLGQIEAGYRMAVYDPAEATLTPFARLQTVAISQGAFGENGAGAINLNVAQQNTTSARTVIGADLGGKLPLGSQRALDLALRLGWAHEFADTARPMTAAFAGAPAVPFTVYGAQPQRNAAVIGLGVSAVVADTTSIYLRYDGEITGSDDNHVFSAGLRMTW